MIFNRFKLFSRNKIRDILLLSLLSLLCLFAGCSYVCLFASCSHDMATRAGYIDQYIDGILAPILYFGDFDYPGKRLVIGPDNRYFESISIHPNGEDWLIIERRNKEVDPQDKNKWIVGTYLLRYNKRTKELYRYDLPVYDRYEKAEFSNDGEYISLVNNGLAKSYPNPNDPHIRQSSRGYSIGNESIPQGRFVFFRVNGEEYHEIFPDLGMGEYKNILNARSQRDYQNDVVLVPSMSLIPSKRSIMYARRWGWIPEEERYKELLKAGKKGLVNKQGDPIMEWESREDWGKFENPNYRLFNFDIETGKNEIFSNADIYAVANQPELGNVSYFKGGSVALVVGTNEKYQDWSCGSGRYHDTVVYKTRPPNCTFADRSLPKNVMKLEKGKDNVRYPLFPGYLHIENLVVNEQGLCGFYGKNNSPRGHFVFADCNEGRVIEERYDVIPGDRIAFVKERRGAIPDFYSISPDGKYVLGVYHWFGIGIYYVGTEKREMVDIPPLKSAILIKLDKAGEKTNQ